MLIGITLTPQNQVGLQTECKFVQRQHDICKTAIELATCAQYIGKNRLVRQYNWGWMAVKFAVSYGIGRKNNNVLEPTFKLICISQRICGRITGKEHHDKIGFAQIRCNQFKHSAGISAAGHLDNGQSRFAQCFYCSSKIVHQNTIIPMPTAVPIPDIIFD